MNSCDTYYSLFPHLDALAVMSLFFLVKEGVPRKKDLQWLSQQLEEWKPVGRRLKIEEARLTAFDNEDKRHSEKIYKMLLHWKRTKGLRATYKVLHDALCHQFVNRTDLAQKLCCQQHK